MEKDKVNPLGTEPVGRLLRKFAIPSIISMLVTSLYNIVDQFFIGRTVGELGNAATNIAFPLTTMCLAAMLALGIGGAAGFNLNMGAGNKKKAMYFIGNALTVMFGVGVVIALISLFFMEPLLKFFGSPDSVLPYAKEYVGVVAFGFPFVMVANFSEKICADLEERFKKVDKIAEYNQLKVIGAMQKNKVAEAHFNTTTGYGYNDLGRETLEKVYADVFHTEDALVRPQITCGTHALALALSANLRPNDKLVYISGKPYDTLEEVIGIRPSNGSLAEYGVKYDQVDLLENGEFDFEGIKEKITNDVKVVGIQRSKGYATRPTLSVEKIGQAIKAVKEINPNIIVMVDNCYGEFVEEIEPSDVGADMIVGSLIKNPGGGLAPIGGYICGTKQCIENCSYRLTTPGLGKEVGANLGVMSSFYQGLFLAPNVVASALKGAIFAANLFEKFNFNVIPDGKESRHDIIQAIEFGNPDCVIAFCKGIQAAAPVDSYLTPEPWDMPGYDAPVIMAAGAFVSGSSIELSADGPIKPPYAVYFQGGLTWHHAKLGILKAFQNMVDDGLITLK